ncbi:MAG: 50S ribosomal protein L35 [Propionibacteriales bacterium]|nr:50S ribosomal protein L35 [Propionibacteriales bacterium]
MPKMKTHSGAKKRFKVTSNGKVRRLQAGRKSGAAFASQPTTGSRRRNRHLSGEVEVSKADTKRIKRVLGR